MTRAGDAVVAGECEGMGKTSFTLLERQSHYEMAAVMAAGASIVLAQV